MDLSGRIESIGFSCVIQMLSMEGKTGILKLSRGQKISAICFKEGEVVAVSSNFGPQLGQLLFDKGLISLEQLDEALRLVRSLI